MNLQEQYVHRPNTYWFWQKNYLFRFSSVAVRRGGKGTLQPRQLIPFSTLLQQRLLQLQLCMIVQRRQVCIVKWYIIGCCQTFFDYMNSALHLEKMQRSPQLLALGFCPAGEGHSGPQAVVQMVDIQLWLTATLLIHRGKIPRVFHFWTSSQLTKSWLILAQIPRGLICMKKSPDVGRVSVTLTSKSHSLFPQFGVILRSTLFTWVRDPKSSASHGAGEASTVQTVSWLLSAHCSGEEFTGLWEPIVTAWG